MEGHIGDPGLASFRSLTARRPGARLGAATPDPRSTVRPRVEGAMKDGLRFVDSDMHVMEAPDLFDRYLDPTFKHRVSVPVGADGRPCRGPAVLTFVDALPTADSHLQQHRNHLPRGPTQSTHPLSGARLTDT